MKRLVTIALITISTFYTACGKIEHEVTGKTDVNVNFNFNLKEIESYFLAFCESINDPDPTKCAKAKTAEFLQYMLSLQQDASQ